MMNITKKQILPIALLVLYCALLIKVIVFKDVPMIRIGHLMFNFGGIESGHEINLVPFKTIGPYLLGYKGWIIAGINLIGNVGLLVPLGVLLSRVYPGMTWKKSLACAVASGLFLETMQTILHIGIFDIDDVILNALGVMIGVWIFLIFAVVIGARKDVSQ